MISFFRNNNTGGCGSMNTPLKLTHDYKYVVFGSAEDDTSNQQTGTINLNIFNRSVARVEDGVKHSYTSEFEILLQSVSAWINDRLRTDDPSLYYNKLAAAFDKHMAKVGYYRATCPKDVKNAIEALLKAVSEITFETYTGTVTFSDVVINDAYGPGLPATVTLPEYITDFRNSTGPSLIGNPDRDSLRDLLTAVQVQFFSNSLPIGT